MPITFAPASKSPAPASPGPGGAGRVLPGLDMRLLADLPGLELRAAYVVDGTLSGRHRSPQKGSSVEFAEYRDYQFGDDLRRVDWRLYARTDRLHVKQFEEETQMRVFLVLDTSASMDYQSRPEVLTKIEFARIALAAIGLIAQRQRDAFGLAVAGTELADFLPARASAAHWRKLVGKLDGVASTGQATLAVTLNSLAELIPARSLVVIASDFYDEPASLEPALRRLRYDHHDLIGLHVLDPQEIDFDLDSSGTFVDAENFTRVKLDVAAARQNYLKRFSAFCAELDDLFHGAGGEASRLRTDESPVAALTTYLARREQRL
jgi:uncharacterized protein (DUF58 family)